MSGGFSFRVTHRDGGARAGEIRTPHGLVQTPAFAPVGTRGAIKAVTHRDLLGLGAEMILANTYHLHLRPGRRSPPFHRLGPADPDRQRGIPSVQSRRSAED